MEPKFQSSFIPKGPVSSTSTIPKVRSKEKSFFNFIASVIFFLAVLAAGAVFGYGKYLESNIAKMDKDLEAAQSSLAAEPIDEFIRLNGRIQATGELVDSHIVLSPLFDFLESSTLKSVRFTEFGYITSNQGKLEIKMKGQATGYSAVALQAEIFKKSEYFANASFSDLNLDDKGNVIFSFTAAVNPALISYKKQVERTAPVPIPEIQVESSPAAAAAAAASTTAPVEPDTN